MSNITYTGFPEGTREHLKAIFDKLSDADDWRNPIDIVVELEEYEVEDVKNAVAYFVGQVPTVMPVRRQSEGFTYGDYRIMSCGYRNGPCGP